MKAFWWFKDGAIAGMARPGFNGIHWFDLPFEEALIFGWLGQRSSDTQPIESMHNHIRDYGAKIFGFFGMDHVAFQRAQESLQHPSKMSDVLDRVAKKTKSVDEFDISDGKITFKLDRRRLDWEIDFLKQNEIRTIVTLTENHNQREELHKHFDLHHLAIDDLNAPRFEQAVQLADVIRQARAERTRMAVHCMAGIGRTSTMLIASHLVLGETLPSLKLEIEKRNPSFQFKGPQADFLHLVAERTGAI